MTPEADTAAMLVRALCGWLERLFPDAGRGERLRRALEQRFGGDLRPVTDSLCREVEGVAQGFSRHFELEYAGDGSLVPDTDAPGWPPQDPDEVRSRAGSVGQVTRGSGGVGVLALDGHDGVHLAAPYLLAAFALLRGARGVVLDLRRNRGGDLGTVTLVLDWLLGGEATHVCDVMYRDRTRQWWTTGRLADVALPRDTPVAVLIGERTFSSAEGLAHHLQGRGRATVVGQRTPGAADHITPVRVTPHVRALLPEGRVRDAVTGTNWEGSGVVPDIACEPERSLETAIAAVADRGVACTMVADPRLPG